MLVIGNLHAFLDTTNKVNMFRELILWITIYNFLFEQTVNNILAFNRLLYKLSHVTEINNVNQMLKE